MEIEKSDVEWLITLIVMILIAFREPNKKIKQDSSPKRKRRKRKR